MKILFITVGNQDIASTRVRVLAYLPFLSESGLNFTIKSSAYDLPNFIPLTDKAGLFSRAVRYLLIRMAWVGFNVFLMLPKFDIIFIQKVLFPPYLQFLFRLRKSKIIFDFDDALYAAPQFYGSEAWLVNQIKTSRLVIAGNENLAMYARKITSSTVTVLPTPVDTNRYQPVSTRNVQKDTVVIGWIGSASTIGHLEMLGSVIEKLLKRYPEVIFCIIGAHDTQLKNLPNVHLKSWNYQTELADLQEFDVGIMPLLDTEFARGKCGYKILQYMAVGIPSVASPIGANTEIINHGVNGFLAQSDDDWVEILSRLIESVDLRGRIGLEARRTVMQNYSYDVVAPQFAGLLRDVVAQDDGRE
jgi:glycosyltransferase involved in cell wall biosynthesis